MGFIGQWLRNRRLRKYRSSIPTGFVPLSGMKKATVILDAEDPTWEECRKEAEDFFRSRGIATDFIYTDFRKFSNGIKPVTEASRTLFRRDIRCFGLPRMKKVRPMLDGQTDLLLSFSTCSDFIMEFVTKSIKARFRIGRCHFPGEPFDMMVVPVAQAEKDQEEPVEQAPQTEVFRTVADFLPKIK